MGDFFGIVFVRPMGLILMAIWSLVQNYGISLILFTLLVKLIILPFMYKQKKSMKKMSLVQTQAAEIQQRYAKNREKMNEEIQKLYEREGVSPMGSCVLSFITLPILMALYYAVRQPMKYMMGLSTDTINEIADALGVTYDSTSVSGQIELAKQVHENWDKVSDFASQGLVNIDFNFLGIDLSAIPQFTHLDILWLIPILSGGTALLSSLVMKHMQKFQNPNAQKNQSAQMNSTMNTMYIIMPLMSVWIAFTLPSSMGVYWTVNNLFSIVQELGLTWFILKFDKAEDDEITKARKRQAAAHQLKLEEQARKNNAADGEKTEQSYRGASSANTSKKKLKAYEAQRQKEKDKETAARSAQIKAEKEAARRAGRQADDE